MDVKTQREIKQDHRRELAQAITALNVALQKAGMSKPIALVLDDKSFDIQIDDMANAYGITREEFDYRCRFETESDPAIFGVKIRRDRCAI